MATWTREVAQEAETIVHLRSLRAPPLSMEQVEGLSAHSVDGQNPSRKLLMLPVVYFMLVTSLSL